MPPIACKVRRPSGELLCIGEVWERTVRDILSDLRRSTEFNGMNLKLIDGRHVLELTAIAFPSKRVCELLSQVSRRDMPPVTLVVCGSN
jgi:hypothetical protein